ncbi:hypothetical protein SAMN05660816_06884 [Niastella yeongjuensis]|nr:hypothetical protein SAMN05660816_06884 [Niastella yeongjuensis]
MKFLYPCLIVVFIGLHSNAQSVEDSARQIANDTSVSIWEYKSSPKVFYLVGKILAKRDVAKGVFLIQSYGNPDWEKPCLACRYENYGFKFVYHWDIIYGTKSAFIDGYNEVSEAYLKTKIGANAFARIEVLPFHYFDPSAILRKFYYSKNRQRFYDLEELNDSRISFNYSILSSLPHYYTLQACKQRRLYR